MFLLGPFGIYGHCQVALDSESIWIGGGYEPMGDGSIKSG